MLFLLVKLVTDGNGVGVGHVSYTNVDWISFWFSILVIGLAGGYVDRMASAFSFSFVIVVLILSLSLVVVLPRKSRRVALLAVISRET